MKRIIKVLIYICLFSFINVSAATFEIKAVDSTTIKEKESQFFDVYLKKDSEEEKIDRIKFEFGASIDDMITATVVSENPYNYLQKSNGYTVDLYKDVAFNDGAIMRFSITNNSSEDGKVDFFIKNIHIISGEEDQLLELETNPSISITLKKQITTTTRAKNTSAKLTGLTVNTSNNNITMKPAFSKDQKNYKIYVAKDTIRKVTITTNTEESGVKALIECTVGCTTEMSEITSSGNKHIIEIYLHEPKNEAIITFVSENEKNKEEYKFIIYHGPTTDGSNLLSDLKVEGFELNEDFNKSSLDYTLTVPFETEKITLTPTPEDENADVKIKGGDKLEVGENTITITVTSAEDEKEKKIYNLKVTREEFVPEEDNTTIVTPIIETTPEAKPEKNNKLLIIIIIAGVSLLIIGLAAYFIFFRKKKDKKIKNQSEKIDTLEELPKVKSKEPVKNVDDALTDLMKTKEMDIEK